ncbi:hypothetical protein H0H92_006047 [Tricholoma furcatifolium]|nr:hypothetical protein H0H92_006047 [Tricholoma furcatifolium]
MSGKTALVTGASSGIGRSTAIALLKAGWNVILTGRREDALQETARLAADSNAIGQSFLISGDVTDEVFVKKLFSEGVEHFGRLDLLFNNAGVGAPQTPIEELPLEAFQKVITVNLISPFLCTQEAIRIFKAQSPQGGRIINNGSLAAHVPRPLASAYTCSKHAITGLTKATALEGRNAHTEMGAVHTLGALQPDGRIVPEATFDVQHVADSIVHIASLPNDVTVLQYNIMLVRATAVPYVGRG